MQSPFNVTARRPENPFRRWAFLPLAVLALAALAPDPVRRGQTPRRHMIAPRIRFSLLLGAPMSRR